MVLLGCAPGDDEAKADALARRVVQARVFPDDSGRMNRDLAAVSGSLLVVSQFTLLGDTSQRRPFFGGALEPLRAEELVRRFVATARTLCPIVETGTFGAHMRVASVNDGPVTLLYDE